MLIASSLFGAAPALAQHAHEPGPNGGRVEEGSGYHIELVTKADRLDVYITNTAYEPVPATGYSGSAIFVIAGKPARIALVPAEGNRLTGRSEAPVAKDAKGAIRLTKPDGTTASISFH
ncbi:MAG: hypothetical protein K2Y56_00475 [Methylobacterium sp.]|nr:hypothetical protein [Methylobacterium sp.]